MKNSHPELPALWLHPNYLRPGTPTPAESTVEAKGHYFPYLRLKAAGGTGDEAADTLPPDCILLEGVVDPKFLIRKGQFKINKRKCLGAGTGGQVFMGKLRSGHWLKPGKDVAIKIQKGLRSEDDYSRFLQELKFMTELRNWNIVGLVGAYVDRNTRGQIYILTEWCEEGSLEQFIAKYKHKFEPRPKWERGTTTKKWNRRLSMVELCRWCEETADGLQYLSYRRILHRDIAARNVLLTRKGTAKISDFGLSRSVGGCPEYQQNTEAGCAYYLPFRWMAPECFEGKYAKGSDVWAFAIFAWELFSLGGLPYAHIEDLTQLPELIFNGLRITEEGQATPEIFEMLSECWDEDPSKRPSFVKLTSFFNFCKMLAKSNKLDDAPAASMWSQTRTEWPAKNWGRYVKSYTPLFDTVRQT